jgi:hypothetical protein
MNDYFGTRANLDSSVMVWASRSFMNVRNKTMHKVLKNVERFVVLRFCAYVSIRLWASFSTNSTKSCGTHPKLAAGEG